MLLENGSWEPKHGELRYEVPAMLSWLVEEYMECATLKVSYWRFFASLIAVRCHRTLPILSEYPNEWC